LFDRFKGPKAVEFLAPLLDHTNGHVRAQTAYVLGYWPEGKVHLAQYREGLDGDGASQMDLSLAEFIDKIFTPPQQ
ncbi:MAG: hypothetical protein JST51_00005, partial [Armatimonadetes bacterium]|nr:hypothetical protein [Armatimonadota bacterium]